MYKTDKWELKYFKNEEKIEIIVREDDGRITNGFAEIPCYGEDDVSYDDQWEIARLLVAAPALLAACKRAYAFRLNGCCNPVDLMKLDKQLESAISAASAETTQK